MNGSTWLDMVVGVDIHFEMVPMPAPVPTPFPHPFVGLVFDPAGLAVSLALSNAIGMAMGGSFKGPVLVNGMPATNTGTEAKNSMVLPHFVIPPGTAWTPMPKAPKPPTKPGAPPATPDSPVAPAGDAVVIMGSKTVFAMGSNFARMGDMAMSCAEPVRLPSSAIIAIPKGPPVVVGGPPAIDWFAAVMAFIRTKSIANLLHGLVGRIRNARLRNFLHFAVCALTGHPVDMASGRVLTRGLDFELPGIMPLRFERNYASSWSDRPGPLGWGWSHALDQAVWIEPGRVVYRADDGREIEFDTMGLRDQAMRAGDEVFDPITGLTLRSLGRFCWQIRSTNGYVWRFEPLPRAPAMARLVSITHPQGATIALSYDDRERLAWVRDCDGRIVRFAHDDLGRLTGIDLPHPSTDGFVPHVRYHYDGHGDLVGVTDALGATTRFGYENHLLVRETDRRGFSFYFGYDGLGPEAYCVRTWGDGGILDRDIAYDKNNKITIVTDSRGNTTLWKFNAVGLPIERKDPSGATTRWAYDERCLKRTLEVDAIGRETKWTYDGRGMCTAVAFADGGEMTCAYDEHGRHVKMVDTLGGEWTWGYDRHGAMAWSRDPLGRTRETTSEAGRMTRLRSLEHGDVVLTRDSHANTRTATHADGRVEVIEYDRRGRPTRLRDRLGVALELRYDALGRVIEERKPTGSRHIVFDPEGNVLEIRDERNHVKLRYEAFNWLVERTDAGGTRRLERDGEGNITAIVTEAGERWAFRYDANNRIVEQIDLAGRSWRCERNPVGDIVTLVRPSGRRTERELDIMGRIVAERFADGSSRTFEWDAASRLLAASNADGTTTFERDVIGRVVCERHDGLAVHSQYGVGGRIAIRTDLDLAIEIGRAPGGDTKTVTARRGGVRLACGYSEVAPHRGTAIEFASGAVALGLRGPGGLPGGLELRDAAGWRRSLAYRHAGRRIVALDDSERGQTVFGHDARGRVVQAAREEQVCVRTLDRAGNPYATVAGDDRRYGPGGRIASVGDQAIRHDADGNLVERRTVDGSWQYEYDGAGCLTAVVRPDGARVELGYDALGRRIRKRTDEGETRWVWDGAAPVHELRGDAVTSWVFSPDSTVPIGRIADDEAWAIATDHRGAPHAVFDGHGRVRWSGGIDLWGAPDKEPPPLPWRFEGQMADADTGLYHQRYRAYDPVTGGYLTPDPLGLLGGLRPYGYVDDALLATDPLGLTQCGPSEQPPNSAVIHMSGSHAAITVFAEGSRPMTTQLLLNVEDEAFERLLRRAEREGPSAYNGSATRVTAGLGDFHPSQGFVVFFESPEAAQAALRFQREALGSGGPYRLGSNSCVTHVEDVLGAGGISSSHGFMNSPSAGSFAGHVENVLNGIPQWW